MTADLHSAAAAVNQEDIFGPFFAMVTLTVVVWVWMYSRRLPFLIGYLYRHKLEDARVLNVPNGKHNIDAISPPSVKNPSDNLKNLFEMPTLFYAVVLQLYVTRQVDAFSVTTAWAFVACRCVHSAIHCTSNVIEYRFASYILSSLSLFLMIFRAAFLWWHHRH